MSRASFHWSSLLLAAVSLALGSGCDCGGSPPASACSSAADCSPGETCIDGACISRRDGGGGGADDGGRDDGGASCSGVACGDGCCGSGEVCGLGGECCAPGDLCGGTCCGGAGERCVADVCVLDCDGSPACGEGASATCCGEGEVCLLGACTTPGAPCATPFDCPEGQYCDGSVGRCLPRATDLPACEYRPAPGEFELEVKWHWSGDPDVMPLHNQVMSAPMVANLNDDNGDGRIDENDIPDVVFNTFRAGNRPEVGGNPVYNADGILRAISGADGSRLWPTSPPTFRTHPALEVAIADVRPDSPGPEIIGCTFPDGQTYGTSRLTIFSATGEILHRFDSVGCSRPAVGDMDNDGVPEIVVANRIVRADGSSVVDAQLTASSAIGTLYDVDGDGDLELIGINGVAHHDGTPLWRDPMWAGESGYVAVADMDLDGDPDIVATSTTSHQITVRDGRTGELLVGPIEVTPVDDPVIAARVEAQRAANPTRDPLTGGGPPTIANFDDDPEPEFALAGGYAYVIFEHDGTRKWYEVTQDTSSRATGSSVFDFEGDGVAEVLYNDELVFRAFRGPTGDVYLERCNTSGTLTEYPIVVDVDNDGHAEIVLVENNYSRNQCGDGSPSSTGVWAFQHPRGQWVRTRRIWNQHSYHVTNIEEDGTVPVFERPNHSTPGLNNFRQNVQPDGLFDAPDLVLRDLGFSIAECALGTLIVRVRVVNEGRAGAPSRVPVSVYVNGTYAGQAQTTRPLLPGESEVVELRYSPVESNTAYELTAVLNDPDHDPLPALNECRPSNNDAGPVLAACPGII